MNKNGSKNCVDIEKSLSEKGLTFLRKTSFSIVDGEKATTINFAATKAKFDEACLRQRGYAKKHGFGCAVFSQVLKGSYPSMKSAKAVAIIDQLRRDGLLVEEEVCETEAA